VIAATITILGLLAVAHERRRRGRLEALRADIDRFMEWDTSDPKR
jgi:hypothetical protein